MSKQACYNTIAVLIVVLVLMLILTGCTHYSVVKGVEGTPEYTNIQVWSNRQFEQPSIHLNKTPESVQFDFGAGSVTSAPSPFETIGAMAVQELLNRMLPPVGER